jgi:hypothetical protein
MFRISAYGPVETEARVGATSPGSEKNTTMESVGMSIMSGVPSFATGYVLGKFVFKESDFYSAAFGSLPGLVFNLMAATMGSVNPIAGTVSSLVCSYGGTKLAHKVTV